MLDKMKSLVEVAILVPGYPVGSPGWQIHSNHERLDPTRETSPSKRDSSMALMVMVVRTQIKGMGALLVQTWPISNRPEA